MLEILRLSRNFHGFSSILVILFCVLIVLCSYYFRGKEQSGYRSIPYPLNGFDERFVNQENVSSSESSACIKKEVKLSKTALPITGLVSFPGSGNTWTRHLIQQMTGIGTSSMYCDVGLQRQGFPFECETQREKTIVVKTHHEKNLHKFKKIVLLVRNPYDALLSFNQFIKAGHTGHLSKKVLVKAFAKQFDPSLQWYVNLIRNTTLEFKGPVHVLQYEKIKANMSKELRSLAVFLNVNVSDQDINCTVQIQEGNFHRHTSVDEHIDILRTIYNMEKLQRLREATRTVEELIKNTYNIELDLGGTVEKTLFLNS